MINTDVVCPPGAQEYDAPPDAVRVIIVPMQTVVDGLTVIPGVGSGSTVMKPDFTSASLPNALVAVSVTE